LINKTATEQLEDIENSIKGSRFTSVSQYLEEKIELLKIRLKELEKFECEGSLKERYKEHQQLSVFLLANLNLLFEHYKIQYRSGKNV
jgi:hypothetical protein